MVTPGLKVPTSLTIMPSSRVKVTREIDSGAVSENRTCKAYPPTTGVSPSPPHRVTGVETSHCARATGGAVGPIRDMSIKGKITLQLLRMSRSSCVQAELSARRSSPRYWACFGSLLRRDSRQYDDRGLHVRMKCAKIVVSAGSRENMLPRLGSVEPCGIE